MRNVVLNIAHLMKKSLERTKARTAVRLHRNELPLKALRHVLMQELQYPRLFQVLKDPYRKVLSDMKSTWGNRNSLFTPCGAT